MNIEIYHSSTLNTNPTLFLPNRNKYLWSKKLRLPTLSKNFLKCVLWGLETAQGKKFSYCASVCIYSSTFPPSKGAAGVDPNPKSLESVAIKLTFRYLLTKFNIYWKILHLFRLSIIILAISALKEKAMDVIKSGRIRLLYNPYPIWTRFSRKLNPDPDKG